MLDFTPAGSQALKFEFLAENKKTQTFKMDFRASPLFDPGLLVKVRLIKRWF